MPEATHPCPIREGAGGLIDCSWCIDNFAERLAQLPADLSEADVLRPDLLLWEEGDVSIYYVPFDRVNPEGKVMLVGLTPGRHQMWLATMAAAQALRKGRSREAALEAASLSGSFAGPMRKNLVGMLDAIGVAHWLGLVSTDLLWSEAGHLRASTSALLHPVFVRQRNYGGGNPRIEKVAILRAFVDQVLAANLALSPEALILPLGKAASSAVERLVRSGKVEEGRVLLGFPHPSGANGHRIRQFEEQRGDLVDQVARWTTGI